MISDATWKWLKNTATEDELIGFIEGLDGQIFKLTEFRDEVRRLVFDEHVESVVEGDLVDQLRKLAGIPFDEWMRGQYTSLAEYNEKRER